MSVEDDVPPARWTVAASMGDLAATGLIECEVDGRPVLLVADGATVHAFQALCPHDHARLCDGRVEGQVLVCPRHLARFRLEDGSAEPGFDLPALARYPVRVIDRRIEIDAAALRPAVRARWDLTAPD